MASAEQRLELPPRPTSAAAARRFVASALAGLEEEHREIGVLLTSELVTNALLYAQSPITVRVVLGDRAIRVGVSDEAASEVRPRQVNLDATSGRGLALVEELAATWGVDQDHGKGKEVWFELTHDD